MNITVSGREIVRPSAMTMNRNAARNFPSTASRSRTGNVISTSMVPSFFSSAQARMVIAGPRKRNIHGSSEKNGRRVDWLARKNVRKKSQCVTPRKARITM